MQPPTPVEDDGFPAALARAVAGSGLTLEHISQQLRAAGTPVSVATLSYWQTGRSAPTRTRSLRAVRHLEALLGTGTGQLLGRLPGDPDHRWDPLRSLPDEDPVARAVRQLGLDQEPGHHTVMVHDTVWVSSDGTSQVETTRQVLQATGHRLERLPLVFGQTNLADPLPRVEVLTGCQLGRVARLEAEGLLACELMLLAPVATDGLVMVEYAVHRDVTHDEEPGIARALGSSMRYAVTEVVFEGEPPRQVVAFEVPRGAQDQVAGRVETPLEPASHLQRVLVSPQGGTHGMEWSW